MVLHSRIAKINVLWYVMRTVASFTTVFLRFFVQMGCQKPPMSTVYDFPVLIGAKPIGSLGFRAPTTEISSIFSGRGGGKPIETIVYSICNV